jgi:hypothetical protein
MAGQIEPLVGYYYQVLQRFEGVGRNGRRFQSARVHKHMRKCTRGPQTVVIRFEDANLVPAAWSADERAHTQHDVTAVVKVQRRTATGETRRLSLFFL